MTATKESKLRSPDADSEERANFSNPESLPASSVQKRCNDFIGLFNIVGAGGNLIVQQVDLPATCKGDARFMQHLDEAWHRSDQGTRDGL
ncbi:hypothetical protein MMC25_008094 [Agyrium rufum]|nr:hypothetical protein [Agyrium rufum]